MTQSEQERVFDDWLTQYRALIFKVVRAYAQMAEHQEDLFQEISLQIWRSIPHFRRESSLATWLYRISLNTAIKWVKKERKHGNSEPLDDSLRHTLKEASGQTDERLGWLYEEISRLNEIDRSVTLLLLDGFSYKEMADILGITESHVGVKINRIKKRLIIKSNKLNGT